VAANPSCITFKKAGDVWYVSNSSGAFFIARPAVPDKLAEIFLAAGNNEYINGALSERDGGIFMGAQNMFYKDAGPYTGEISPSMLLREQVTFVMLGHPERTRGVVEIVESYELVNKKVKAALAHGLTPAVFVSETLDERKRGATREVLINQLSTALRGINRRQAQQVIIIYLPLWVLEQRKLLQKAIDPAEAQEVCHALRTWLAQNKRFGPRTSQQIRLLYGRFVDEENVSGYLEQPDIDGVFVARAAVPAQSASRIVLQAQQYAQLKRKKPLVIFNLKMFERGDCIMDYYRTLKKCIGSDDIVDVVVCPTFLDIPYLSMYLEIERKAAAEKQALSQKAQAAAPLVLRGASPTDEELAKILRRISCEEDAIPGFIKEIRAQFNDSSARSSRQTLAGMKEAFEEIFASAMQDGRTIEVVFEKSDGERPLVDLVHDRVYIRSPWPIHEYLAHSMPIKYVFDDLDAAAMPWLETDEQKLQEKNRIYRSFFTCANNTAYVYLLLSMLGYEVKVAVGSGPVFAVVQRGEAHIFVDLFTGIIKAVNINDFYHLSGKYLALNWPLEPQAFFRLKDDTCRKRRQAHTLADAELFQLYYANIYISDVEGLNAVMYKKAARTYDNLKDRDASMRHYLKAIELNPDYAVAYVGAGFNYLEKGEYNYALEYFSAARDLNPSDYGCYLGLGLAQYYLGNKPETVDNFVKAVLLNPYNLRVIDIIGEEGKAAILARVERIIPRDVINKILALDSTQDECIENRGSCDGGNHLALACDQEDTLAIFISGDAARWPCADVIGPMRDPGFKGPKIIGLAGFIGSAKTTVSALIEIEGRDSVRIINMDMIGHEVRAEPSVIKKITDIFGHGVLAADGTVDRKKLGAIVFTDENALAALNSIMSAPMQERALARIQEAIGAGKKIIVIEAAALNKMKKISSACDEIWLIDTDTHIRHERLAGRGLSEK